jgi:hypothetical protein
MTNILASTTQILDMLVPLEGPERQRVINTVRAVLDLVDEPTPGRPWSPDHWDAVVVSSRGVVGTIDPKVGGVTKGTMEPPTDWASTKKEKPQPAAPKARKMNEPGEFRLEFRREIPSLLQGFGKPLSPAEMRHALLVPDERKSTFAEALRDLIKAGKVVATGRTAGRRYTIA